MMSDRKEKKSAQPKARATSSRRVTRSRSLAKDADDDASGTRYPSRAATATRTDSSAYSLTFARRNSVANGALSGRASAGGDGAATKKRKSAVSAAPVASPTFRRSATALERPRSTTRVPDAPSPKRKRKTKSSTSRQPSTSENAAGEAGEADASSGVAVLHALDAVDGRRYVVTVARTALSKLTVQHLKRSIIAQSAREAEKSAAAATAVVPPSSSSMLSSDGSAAPAVALSSPSEHAANPLASPRVEARSLGPGATDSQIRASRSLASTAGSYGNQSTDDASSSAVGYNSNALGGSSSGGVDSSAATAMAGTDAGLTVPPPPPLDARNFSLCYASRVLSEESMTVADLLPRSLFAAAAPFSSSLPILVLVVQRHAPPDAVETAGVEEVGTDTEQRGGAVVVAATESPQREEATADDGVASVPDTDRVEALPAAPAARVGRVRNSDSDSDSDSEESESAFAVHVSPTEAARRASTAHTTEASTGRESVVDATLGRPPAQSAAPSPPHSPPRQQKSPMPQRSAAAASERRQRSPPALPSTRPSKPSTQPSESANANTPSPQRRSATRESAEVGSTLLHSPSRPSSRLPQRSGEESRPRPSSGVSSARDSSVQSSHSRPASRRASAAPANASERPNSATLSASSPTAGAAASTPGNPCSPSRSCADIDEAPRPSSIRRQAARDGSFASVPRDRRLSVSFAIPESTASPAAAAAATSAAVPSANREEPVAAAASAAAPPGADAAPVAAASPVPSEEPSARSQPHDPPSSSATAGSTTPSTPIIADKSAQPLPPAPVRAVNTLTVVKKESRGPSVSRAPIVTQPAPPAAQDGEVAAGARQAAAPPLADSPMPQDPLQRSTPTTASSERAAESAGRHLPPAHADSAVQETSERRSPYVPLTHSEEGAGAGDGSAVDDDDEEQEEQETAALHELSDAADERASSLGVTLGSKVLLQQYEEFRQLGDLLQMGAAFLADESSGGSGSGSGSSCSSIHNHHSSAREESTQREPSMAEPSKTGAEPTTAAAVGEEVMEVPVAPPSPPPAAPTPPQLVQHVVEPTVSRRGSSQDRAGEATDSQGELAVLREARAKDKAYIASLQEALHLSYRAQDELQRKENKQAAQLSACAEWLSGLQPPPSAAAEAALTLPEARELLYRLGALHYSRQQRTESLCLQHQLEQAKRERDALLRTWTVRVSPAASSSAPTASASGAPLGGAPDVNGCFRVVVRVRPPLLSLAMAALRQTMQRAAAAQRARLVSVGPKELAAVFSDFTGAAAPASPSNKPETPEVEWQRSLRASRDATDGAAVQAAGASPAPPLGSGWLLLTAQPSRSAESPVTAVPPKSSAKSLTAAVAAVSRLSEQRGCIHVRQLESAVDATPHTALSAHSNGGPPPARKARASAFSFYGVYRDALEPFPESALVSALGDGALFRSVEPAPQEPAPGEDPGSVSGERVEETDEEGREQDDEAPAVMDDDEAALESFLRAHFSATSAGSLARAALQDRLFDSEVLPLLHHVYAGRSASVIAYGADGSGKSYALFGSGAAPAATARAAGKETARGAVDERARRRRHRGRHPQQKQQQQVLPARNVSFLDEDASAGAAAAAGEDISSEAESAAGEEPVSSPRGDTEDVEIGLAARALRQLFADLHEAALAEQLTFATFATPEDRKHCYVNGARSATTASAALASGEPFYSVQLSLVELYNDKLFDLLAKPLKVPVVQKFAVGGETAASGPDPAPRTTAARFSSPTRGSGLAFTRSSTYAFGAPVPTPVSRAKTPAIVSTQYRTESPACTLRVATDGSPEVEGLSQHTARSAAEAIALLAKGLSRRRVHRGAEDAASAISAARPDGVSPNAGDGAQVHRSHLILTVHVVQTKCVLPPATKGTAGKRARQRTGASADRTPKGRESSASRAHPTPARGSSALRSRTRDGHSQSRASPGRRPASTTRTDAVEGGRKPSRPRRSPSVEELERRMVMTEHERLRRRSRQRRSGCGSDDDSQHADSAGSGSRSRSSSNSSRTSSNSSATDPSGHHAGAYERVSRAIFAEDEERYGREEAEGSPSTSPHQSHHARKSPSQSRLSASEDGTPGRSGTSQKKNKNNNNNSTSLSSSRRRRRARFAITLRTVKSTFTVVDLAGFGRAGGPDHAGSTPAGSAAASHKSAEGGATSSTLTPGCGSSSGAHDDGRGSTVTLARSGVPPNDEDRRLEGRFVNRSLLALGDVMTAVTENARRRPAARREGGGGGGGGATRAYPAPPVYERLASSASAAASPMPSPSGVFVPYRSNKLTCLLHDVLCGSARANDSGSAKSVGSRSTAASANGPALCLFLACVGVQDGPMVMHATGATPSTRSAQAPVLSGLPSAALCSPAFALQSYYAALCSWFRLGTRVSASKTAAVSAEKARITASIEAVATSAAIAAGGALMRDWAAVATAAAAATAGPSAEADTAESNGEERAAGPAAGTFIASSEALTALQFAARVQP